MTIAIRQIMIPRLHRYISQGQVVRITAQLIDQGDSSASLVDSDTAPLLTLYNPLDAIIFTDVEMFHSSKGHYRVEHQTSSSSPLGVYTGSFSVNHENSYARIEKISLFKIYKGSLFPTFNYLCMKDQSDQTWCMWFLVDGSLYVSSEGAPDYINYISTPLLATEPYWISVINPLLQVRYIYPLEDGTLAVSSTQPVVGTGVSSNVDLTGINQHDYRFAVDIDDVIIFIDLG